MIQTCTECKGRCVDHFGDTCWLCEGTGKIPKLPPWYDENLIPADICVRYENEIQKLHEAIAPYIAGGSEYTGISGLLRAIKEVGKRERDAFENLKKQIINRKKLEEENKRLWAFVKKVSKLRKPQVTVRGYNDAETARRMRRVLTDMRVVIGKTQLMAQDLLKTRESGDAHDETE